MDGLQAWLEVSPRTDGWDIVRMNALDLSRAIWSRQISCVEVMAAYVDHIERLNPRVNAIVSLRPRSDLLKEAQERDDQLARGEYLGWMHGFPHAVKDLAATKGLRTTQGSLICKDHVPKHDAIFVERIRRAGAVLIGKTNTPEFGLGSQTYNAVFGTTLNAYDRSKTAGGSSGGAAAAVALRMLPVADGSDSAGSVRNPAAFNNLFGLRPSAGRVPAEGRDIFLPSLGVIGPIARTVRDVSLLFSVQAGHDGRVPSSIPGQPELFTGSLERDLRDVRIGWLGDMDGHLPFEPGVLGLCVTALQVFEALGCKVEPANPEFPMEAVWSSFLKLRFWQTGGALKHHFDDPAKRALMRPEAHWEVEGGLRLGAYDVYDASVIRAGWYRAVRRLFERYDFLALPSAQVFPFDATTHWPKAINGRRMDTYHRWMEVVVPATMAGCPVMAVPCGFNLDGLPMGLQIIGPNQADLACLQLAFAYDRATNWVEARPPALLADPRPRLERPATCPR